MARNSDDAAAERLKAALHYTTGKICTVTAQEQGLGCSKQFMAALTEVAFKQLEATGRDLELFARHAKRSIITTDDVKLCTRRNEALDRELDRIATAMARPKDPAAAEAAAARKSAAKGKAKAVHADDSSEEDADNDAGHAGKKRKT